MCLITLFWVYSLRSFLRNQTVSVSESFILQAPKCVVRHAFLRNMEY